MRDLSKHLRQNKTKIICARPTRWNRFTAAQSYLLLWPNKGTKEILQWTEYVLRKNGLGGRWRDGSKRLSTLVPAEDPESVSQNHRAAHNSPKLQFQGIQCHLLNSMGARHSCAAHSYMQKNIQTQKIIFV